MANLPEDLVLKIFSKLPAKPLSRLKCLSKHWNHLISDPYFMKSIRSRQMTLLAIHSFHAMDNRDHSIVKLGSPFRNSKIEDVIIAGTFNGIVLLILKYPDFDYMILYNPFTGVFKLVPDPDLDPPLIASPDTFTYGFGYGTTPDDLKIVRLEACCRSKSFEIFGLKSGSWSTPSKLISRDFALLQDAGTFLNGFLYWIAYSFDDSRLLVVALDVKEMVFSKIPLPCSTKMADGLDTLDGHLCVFINAEEYGLWIMQEDGSEKSWSKVCMPGIDINEFHPLCILDDRKVVMLKQPNHLIIHDMLNDWSKKVYEDKTNTLKYPSNRWRTYAIKYVESLISPSDLCSTLILQIGRAHV